MKIRTKWSFVVPLALVGFTSCSGSSTSGSSTGSSTTVDRCRDRSGGGVSHDEAREAHQSGEPAGAYRTAGYGSRSTADRPPEWWGRSEVDPCSTDEEPPALSGPLLLDSDDVDDDHVDADDVDDDQADPDFSL